MDPGYFQRRSGLMTRLHLDPWLLLLLLLLVGFGMAVLYSASDNGVVAVKLQATRFAVAFLLMLGFAQIDPAVYRRWSPWLYTAGLMGLFAVLFIGVGSKGAQRWLDLPGLPRFQPSEFMKLAVPMMVAWYLANRMLPPRLGTLGVAFVMLAVPVALIARQPDLGTAVLVGSSGLFVLFLAGLSWKLIGSFMGLGLLVAPGVWLFALRDYQKQRIMTLLDPSSDPLGAGWNITQSKTAIGSGGLSGKGWNQGTQSSLDFLPESHTDFIVAVLAEEFGFIGMVILLTLYALIVLRCLFIAANGQDSFARLLAGGLTLTFFTYVFVNIGMVSGILPVVGVPLPLVSYGGTSMLTLMAGFGILMAVHTHRRMLTEA
ncbi:MAG: rod shape-determining protein RodA [Halomonadaceae bacterium]|nr:MAG: rod shape-determining protein RodA [Halomonadaceae bacterium]